MAPGLNGGTTTAGIPAYMKTFMGMEPPAEEEKAIDEEPEWMEYVADYDRIAVRAAPSKDAPLAAALIRGETFRVSATIREAGDEWLKIPKGSEIETMKNGSLTTRKIAEDVFVLSVHPDLGRLVKPKHVQVSVKQVQEEGHLSKEEMQQILADASSPKDLVIPLEAKTWSKQQFQHYVLSGGMIRPKGCSIPDSTFMLNTDMTQSEIESAMAQAAAWITEADAILVGSGAGMGVDSGLATFRGGKAGVWPGLEAVGLAYEEICDPKWFLKEPELAWAFWNFCHKAYQDTKPHQGYELVRQWAERAPLGAFSFTSNIDSHWIASGWSHKSICEVHGAVSWLQCSRGCCPDVWVAPKDLGLKEHPKTHRVEGDFPQCRKCGKPARPCVQMFGGDQGFAKGRRNLQITRYDGWLKKMEARRDAQDLRIVCIELGCGLTVPTVRKELESVVRRFKGGRLIRVNPENPGLAQELKDSGVSLPMAAGAALRILDPQVAVNSKPVTVVIWDEHGGGVELVADRSMSAEKVLRMAESKDGVEIEVPKSGMAMTFAVNPFRKEIFEALMPGSPLPENFIVDLTEGLIGSQKRKDQEGTEDAEKEDGSSLKMGSPGPLIVLKCRNLRFTNGLHKNLASRVEQVEKMLDDFIEKFDSPEYQENVRKQKDRRGVQQMAKEVQMVVLPKYGLPSTDKGVFIMQGIIGTCMLGLGERVGPRAEASMQASYIYESAKLPAVVKEDGTSLETTSEAGSEQVDKEKDEKPEPPKPTALKVTVSQLGADNPTRVGFRVMSNTTAAELRAAIADLLGLDSRNAKNVKLVMKMRGQFATMKPDEIVRAEMYVNGIDETDVLRLKEIDLAADSDEVNADSSADSSGTSLTIDAIRWFSDEDWGGPRTKKVARLKMSPSSLVSDFRDELQKVLKLSRDRCRRMKFVQQVCDQFIPLGNDDTVTSVIFVRDLGEGEAFVQANPKKPLRAPPIPKDFPTGFAVHVNFSFASMNDEERAAWFNLKSISMWDEWNKIHNSALFRKADVPAFRDSVWKPLKGKGRPFARAEAHHAQNDPILRYYASEDPLLISLWFELPEKVEAGVVRAPADTPAEEEIPQEELIVKINLDVELELFMDLTVQSGITIYQLKEKLAEAAIAGDMSAKDFQLGLPSPSGNIFPLPDTTRLSREHLVLEVVA